MAVVETAGGRPYAAAVTRIATGGDGRVNVVIGDRPPQPGVSVAHRAQVFRAEARDPQLGGQRVERRDEYEGVARARRSSCVTRV